MTTLNAMKSLPPQLEITQAFQGPNIWSRLPVLVVQWNVLDFSFSRWDRADELLTSLELEPVGTTERCPEEAMADWLSAAAIQLQIAAGSPVSFRDWCISDELHRIAIAIEFEEEKLARAVVETLRRWIASLVLDEQLAVGDDWTRLREYAYEVRLGNTTGAIVSAASARGIPFQRLDQESLVQLGQGRYQRRIRGATTDRTSAIAISVATDKQLTKQLLRDAGIPVPYGRLVSDAEDACRAANEIGWPVVVKPCDADYGDGVSIRLTSADEVRESFANAKAWSKQVLVESFVPGTLFRLLVINNRLAGAVRRESPYVIGDGRRTIRELVEEANHDPYRDECCPSPLNALLAPTSNAEPFARDGRSNDTVVEQGRTIALRRDIFLRSGGTQADRTADVHPEIARMAIDATRIIGLD
ncbi:MAG: acetate--CoA ligase family protein, partial [Planctomycetes bacterium]|nr:acetate--CoA ligase family protein [Planctomycetota bacterium]